MLFVAITLILCTLAGIMMLKEDLEKITLEKKPGSSVTLTGELPFSYLETHRTTAIKAVGKDIEVDGFRKGHVPENILISKVGEMAILSEMAERALSSVYPELIKMHGLDVIGYPQISITKLAKDNPLGFTFTVAVVPDIKLPDYMGIAKDINKKKESKEVTNEEVEKQIQDILRQKVAYEKLQAKAQKNAEEKEHVHDENCDHGDEKEVEDKHIEKPEDIPVPELTDELVKSLGQPGQFTNVDDFKSKLREHLTIQKAQDVDSRHRAKITDAIIEKTEMELPQILIDAEIGQMFAQMEQDLERAGLKMDDYLAHIKKTKEDLKKEWAPSAEKRAKLQLVLNEISKKEKIIANTERVQSEVNALMEQYKDADRTRVETYIRSALTNDEVLKKLEEAE